MNLDGLENAAADGWTSVVAIDFLKPTGRVLVKGIYTGMKIQSPSCLDLLRKGVASRSTITEASRVIVKSLKTLL